MADVAKQKSPKQLEPAIDQTLINLRTSFTPDEWTEKEQDEVRSQLEDIEYLAKAILERKG
ncbi:MAG: hypothetical protein AAGG68_12840 [Bacteroidota bacterium]